MQMDQRLGHRDGRGIGPPGRRAAAKTVGTISAQQEHQQPVALAKAAADAIAVAVEHRLVGADERAFEGGVEQFLGRGIDRRGPGAVERLGAGGPAQAIGGGFGHIDALRRGGDRSGIGKRLDKGALLVGRPAILAALAQHRHPLIGGGVVPVRVERGGGCGFGGGRGLRAGRGDGGNVAHPPVWNIKGTCRKGIFWAGGEIGFGAGAGFPVEAVTNSAWVKGASHKGTKRAGSFPSSPRT